MTLLNQCHVLLQLLHAVEPQPVLDQATTADHAVLVLAFNVASGHFAASYSEALRRALGTGFLDLEDLGNGGGTQQLYVLGLALLRGYLSLCVEDEVLHVLEELVDGLVLTHNYALVLSALHYQWRAGHVEGQDDSASLGCIGHVPLSDRPH